MRQFFCPNQSCGVRLNARADQVGGGFCCPVCGTPVTVPPAARDEAHPSGPTAELEDTGVGVSVSTLETPEAPAAEPSRPWQPGTVLLDDFVVKKHLGRGGMGDVYLVRSRSTGEHYAAKRVQPQLLRNEEHRRLFLAELRTWIDLPEHPHLTACRFFHTVEEETVIFAEYLAGGSLEGWIRRDKVPTLGKILQVATQIAWGLDVAHQRGLVHQDVKPGNVLMTSDGQAKVTDFGLAKARTIAGAALAARSGEGFRDVTGAFGTPAYQSPEQARLERLSHKTDVWSWGLCVLAMFTGGCAWHSGVVAAQVLEARLKAATRGDPNALRVTLPEAVAEVLRRCFRADPDERWDSIGNAAKALVAIFRAELRHVMPEVRKAASRPRRAPLPQPRTPSEGEWPDPIEWWKAALRAAGEDASQADRHVAPQAGSRRARAVNDLIAFEEALGIYTRLVAEGRTDLEEQLAALCAQKAVVHSAAGDQPGQLAMQSRAIELCERLVKQGRRHDLAETLASRYFAQGRYYHDLGDHGQAIAFYDRAAAIFQRSFQEQQTPELADRLSLCCINKAISHNALGRTDAAMPLCDRAIELRQTWPRLDDPLRDHNTAACYKTKADCLQNLGNHEEAIALYDQAIGMRHELLKAGVDSADISQALAWNDACKGRTLIKLGRTDEAFALYDLAVQTYRRLVDHGGHWEMADNLARCLSFKADGLRDLGNRRAAAPLYAEVTAILDRLVSQHGRRSLADFLAISHLERAEVAVELSDFQTAMPEFDAAIEMFQRLVGQENRKDLAARLARCYQGKADAAARQRNVEAAAFLLDKAIETLEPLLRRRWDPACAGRLANCYYDKACALVQMDYTRLSLEVFDQAIGLLERLVHKEAQQYYSRNLALAYWDKARLIRSMGSGRTAAGLLDRAIDIFQRNVGQRYDSESADELARLYFSKAVTLEQCEAWGEAIAFHEKAIAIRTRLLEKDGRADLLGDLAGARLHWAFAAKMLGRRREAKAVAREAAPVLKAELQRTRRADLRNMLRLARERMRWWVK